MAGFLPTLLGYTRPSEPQRAAVGVPTHRYRPLSVSTPYAPELQEDASLNGPLGPRWSPSDPHGGDRPPLIGHPSSTGQPPAGEGASEGPSLGVQQAGVCLPSGTGPLGACGRWGEQQPWLPGGPENRSCLARDVGPCGLGWGPTTLLCCWQVCEAGPERQG